jgi:L-serine dehydratase
MGWLPDEARIPEAGTFAEKNGLEYSFTKVNLGELAHPNTVRFKLEGEMVPWCQVTGLLLAAVRSVLQKLMISQ